MRKCLLRLCVMQHVFLNAEVIDRDIQMQRGRHTHRRHVTRSMATRLHVVKRGEVRRFLHRGQATAMHHAHAQVVNQLLADQLLRIPDGVEDLSNRKRRRRVLANEPKTVLQFRRNRIFQPKQVIRLSSLPRRAASMGVSR
jgi:hypothetical protein